MPEFDLENACNARHFLRFELKSLEAKAGGKTLEEQARMRELRSTIRQLSKRINAAMPVQARMF